MTKEIVVTLDPRPGTLAELLGRLAKDGVNIRGGYGTNVGDFDTWHMVVDDDARAERALRGSHVAYRTYDVALTEVDDRPGTLLAACERIASRGINIRSIFNLGGNRPGRSVVAFRVDDPKGAEAALRGM